MKPILTFFVFLYFIVVGFSQEQKTKSPCPLKLTACCGEVRNSSKLLAEKRVKEMKAIRERHFKRGDLLCMDTIVLTKKTYNSLGKVLVNETHCYTWQDSIQENDESFSDAEIRLTVYEYLSDTVLTGYKYYIAEGDTLVNTASRIYDKLGRIMTENHQTNKSIFPYINRFYYNEDGQLDKMAKIPYRGRSKLYTYKYDCKKRTITEKQQFGKIKKIIYYFDEDFRFQSFKINFRRGGTYQVIHERDKDGKVIKIIQHSKYPKKALETSFSEISYDADGLMVKLKYTMADKREMITNYIYTYW